MQQSGPVTITVEGAAGAAGKGGAGGAGAEVTGMPCFAAGTRIFGIDGEILVEDIKPGGPARDGPDDAPTGRVIWTGQRRVNIAQHPDQAEVSPVCITAGAFGPGMPERDLRLSPRHAVYLEGKLVEAVALLNASTIYQDTACRHLTYHHIELVSHDIILAEGCPVQSYLDTGSRHDFKAGGVTGRPRAACRCCVIKLHWQFCARSLRDAADWRRSCENMPGNAAHPPSPDRY